MSAAATFLALCVPSVAVQRHQELRASHVARNIELFFERQGNYIDVLPAEVVEAADALGFPIEGEYIGIERQSISAAFGKRTRRHA